MADVLLITMPWDMLGSPSLALGTLQTLLREGGLTVATRSLKLRWMEHLLAHQRRKRDVITLEDYEDVACHGGGLGDWVFAEPPIAARGRVAEYGRFLRTRRAGSAMRKLLEMRRLAPGFLDRCTEEILAAQPRAVLLHHDAHSEPGVICPGPGASSQAVLALTVLLRHAYRHAPKGGPPSRLLPPSSTFFLHATSQSNCVSPFSGHSCPRYKPLPRPAFSSSQNNQRTLRSYPLHGTTCIYYRTFSQSPLPRYRPSLFSQ